MAVTLGSHGKVGFQIQSAEGTPADGTNIGVLQLTGECDFNLKKNLETVPVIGLEGFETLAYSLGQWFEGNIDIQLTWHTFYNLMTWATSYDSDGQGKWSTVWLMDDKRSVRVDDTKVQSITLKFRTGSVVGAGVGLVSIGTPTTSTPSSKTDPSTSAPIIWKDIELVVGYWDDELTWTERTNMSLSVTSMDITIENQLQSPSDGMSMDGSYAPRNLNNVGRATVRGSITAARETDLFRDLSYYQTEAEASDPSYRWWNKQYSAYLRMYVGAAAAPLRYRIDVPLAKFVNYRSGTQGSRRGVTYETVDFIGLGAYDHGSLPADAGKYPIKIDSI